MKPERFAIRRADGRSNAQVLIDYFAGVEIGHVLPYEELAVVLSNGAARSFDTMSVRQAVLAAAPRLLREHQRAINNVRGVGYRLAPPVEQRGLALMRKRKSDVQLRYSVNLMDYTDLGGMSAKDREAHENTRMVIGAVYRNQMAMEKRLQAVEKAIGLAIASKGQVVAG